MLSRMPTTPRSSSSGKRRLCTALTTAGQPCQRVPVAGLTVCKSHGGGTAASVRVSKRVTVAAQVAVLWGVHTGPSLVSVEEELQKLARNKITDILALRLYISENTLRHIGTLTESITVAEYDITGTVQSKEGTQETRTKRAGTSPWVSELHKAEQELVQILRLLQEVTGGSEEVDTRRIRMQTAREAARILKAFPGISVDQVAAEVSKRAS